MYLSVIIPAYNCASVLENNIPYLQNVLQEKNYEFEILVVDDGSNDKGLTRGACERLGCRYLRNESNLGKGAAVQKGMLSATGKFRIFTDADIPFEAEAFERFLYNLDQGGFDVAIGDRTLQESRYRREIPTLRKVASSLFSFFVGRFVAGGMYDTQCGMKGFRSEVAQSIFSVTRIRGFAIDVEILSIALKRNYSIKRLPVSLRSQEGTSVRILKHSITMMLDLFRVKYNHLAGRYAINRQ